GIEYQRIEVDDRVEDAGSADEGVQRLAFLVLLGRAVRCIARAERGEHRRADDAHARDAGAQSVDADAQRARHVFEARIAVLAEIVDALEPDHGRYAGKGDHVALEAPHGSRPAGVGLLRAVLRRSGDLVAANARVHDGEAATVA